MSIHLRVVLLYCLLPCTALGQISLDQPVATSTHVDMIVHPGYVTDGTGKRLHTHNGSNKLPLIWALEHTGDPVRLNFNGESQHGWTIELRAGLYPPFIFNHSAPVWRKSEVGGIGSTEQTPVTVTGQPGAIITRPATDGGTTVQVLAANDASHSFHHIKWVGVTFEAASQGATIGIGSNSDILDGIVYQGWEFHDCIINGLYDHYSDSGVDSKWGVSTYAVADFLWDGGGVHDLHREHAFYFRNNAGDVTVRNAWVNRVGGLFVQAVARETESGLTGLPANDGDITIENNIVVDCGFVGFGGDGHAGGLITITGRNNGFNKISGNSFFIGYDNDLEDAIYNKYQGTCCAQPVPNCCDPNYIYGESAILSWTTDADNLEFSESLLVQGNYVWYDPGAENTEPGIVSTGTGPAAGWQPAIRVNAINKAIIKENVVHVGDHSTALTVGEGTPYNPRPMHYCVTDDNVALNGGVWTIDNQIAQDIPFASDVWMDRCIEDEVR